MIARLILALLLAAFALPAMASAPCHDGSGKMTGMTMGHDAPAPAPMRDHEKAIAVHSCMGCIPPASLVRPAFAVPLRPEGAMRIVALVRFDAGRSSPPATPPPRTDA
ncbi:hypothetical protein [Sphingomonas sp. GB1N7]|uniref:hypothetical protein n=1 Tax=Parasphingomonas caseinilytica TaxID=3096158 RepID=UPI002FC96B6A